MLKKKVGTNKLGSSFRERRRAFVGRQSTIMARLPSLLDSEELSNDPFGMNAQALLKRIKEGKPIGHWLLIILLGEDVLVDRKNHIIQITVFKRRCRLESDTLLTPDFFCAWMRNQFDVNPQIGRTAWKYVVGAWVRRAKEAVLIRPKPIVPVPIPARVWDKMPYDFGIFTDVFTAISAVIGDAECWISLCRVPNDEPDSTNMERALYRGEIGGPRWMQ